MTKRILSNPQKVWKWHKWHLGLSSVFFKIAITTGILGSILISVVRVSSRGDIFVGLLYTVTFVVALLYTHKRYITISRQIQVIDTVSLPEDIQKELYQFIRNTVLKLGKNICVEILVSPRDYTIWPSAGWVKKAPHVIVPVGWIKFYRTDKSAAQATVAHEVAHLVQKDTSRWLYVDTIMPFYVVVFLVATVDYVLFTSLEDSQISSDFFLQILALQSYVQVQIDREVAADIGVITSNTSDGLVSALSSIQVRGMRRKDKRVLKVRRALLVGWRKHGVLPQPDARIYLIFLILCVPLILLLLVITALIVSMF